MQVGDVVHGRFELLQLAGRGGMGDVYRARDRTDGSVVAVKLLTDRQPMLEERFAREARLLEQLRHPRIVRHIHHAAEPEPYIAMEWLEGEDLRSRLLRDPLTTQESLEVVRQVAEGLAVAHAQSIFHRDVKPDNVFLQDGRIDRVKLLDFGVARIRAQTRILTGTGVAIGTPAYMAPEQARGQRDVDHRADLFSVGCILYECVVGAPPFQGDHAIAILAKILLQEPPRLRDVWADAPAALDALVADLLVKEPERRLSDAREVIRRLEAIEVPSHGRARRVVPAPTMTTAEQRMVSLVLMGSTDAELESAPTVSAELDPAGDIASLVGIASADVCTLAGGAMVVTFRAEPGVDQARHALHFARAVRQLTGKSVGVVTGRAVVSSRLPSGEAVDRAVEMLGGAPPGEVIVDDLTRMLLMEDVAFARWGANWLPREPRQEQEEPSAVRVLGRRSPYVGRRRELLALRAHYDECAEEERPGVAVVVGAAGIGKSRLISELLQGLAEEDPAPTSWTSRCDSLGSGSPFGVVGSLLRSAAGIAAGAPVEQRRAALRRFLEERLEKGLAQRAGEFLGEVLDAAPEEEGPALRAARRDPALMAERIGESWRALLDAQCRRGPLVLAIEDLHWGDLSTVRLIDAALRAGEESPLFVLASGRPELLDVFPGLWADCNADVLRLGPLSKRACSELAREILGDGAQEQQIARLVDQAGGNPLFLEELMRVRADDQGGELPATVLLVVEARIASLDLEARRLLRAGSIFGQRFWRQGVERLVGEVSGSVGTWLAHLEELELVQRRPASRFPDERELAFRHDLIREAAYAMLTPEDRELGHRLALSWLVEAGEEDALVLAEHAARGRLDQEATRHYLRAAEQALEGHDLDGASRCALLAERSGAKGEVLGAARLVLARASKWRGDREAQAAHASSAVALLPTGSPAWCDAVGEATVAADRLGRADVVRDLAGRLVDVLRSGELTPAQVIAAARVAAIAVLAGEPALAEPLLEPLLRDVPRIERDPAAAARLHQALAILAQRRGDPSTVPVHTGAAARFFEQAGDVRNACAQRINHAMGCMEVGDLPEAEGALRAATELAQRIGLRAVAAAGRQNLGVVLAARGRHEEALEVETEAVAELTALGDTRMEAYARAYLGSIQLELRNMGAAREQLEAALRLCADDPTVSATSYAHLASVLLAEGDEGEALGAAERARSIMDATGGLQEGELLVRRVHSEALHANGRKAEAMDVLAEARRRLLQRADAVGDEGMRRTFLEGLPEHARILALARRWGVRSS